MQLLHGVQLPGPESPSRSTSKGKGKGLMVSSWFPHPNAPFKPVLDPTVGRGAGSVARQAITWHAWSAWEDMPEIRPHPNPNLGNPGYFARFIQTFFFIYII